MMSSEPEPAALSERAVAFAHDVYEVLNRQNFARIGDDEIERLIDPFVDDVRRLHRNDLADEAKWLCQGLLLGLRQFDGQFAPAVRGWSIDLLRQIAREAVRAWRNGATRDEVAEMSAFIQGHLGEWGERLGVSGDPEG